MVCCSGRPSIEIPDTPEATPSLPWQHRHVEEPPLQPLRTRRRDRRPARNQSQQVARRSTSFFGSLFDRPMRRRYARSINQNATNLVRRLSQSRLFLNSSRNNTPSAPTTPVIVTADTSRLVENEQSNQHRLTMQPNGNEYQPLSTSLPNVAALAERADDRLLSDIVIQRLRSESPPPAYKDVITIKVDESKNSIGK